MRRRHVMVMSTLSGLPSSTETAPGSDLPGGLTSRALCDSDRPLKMRARSRCDADPVYCPPIVVTACLCTLEFLAHTNLLSLDTTAHLECNVVVLEHKAVALLFVRHARDMKLINYSLSLRASSQDTCTILNVIRSAGEGGRSSELLEAAGSRPDIFTLKVTVTAAAHCSRWSELLGSRPARIILNSRNSSALRCTSCMYSHVLRSGCLASNCHIQEKKSPLSPRHDSLETADMMHSRTEGQAMQEGARRGQHHSRA